MTKGKSPSNTPSRPTPPSKGGQSGGSRGQGTNPINKSGNYSGQTTTSSTGPKSPANKR